MRKLYFVVAMLVMSVVMLAGGNKPLRVVVLGDDPMMVSD